MPAIKNSNLRSGIERLTLIDPDLAFAEVRWELESSPASPPHIQGMGLRVLQYLHESWQILAYEDTLIRAQGR